MHEPTTQPNTVPCETSNERTAGGASPGQAPSLVGFAGLAAMALLLGMSPWGLWPFVISVTLVLCAVMLTRNCSTPGVTVIGVVTGVLWVISEAWQSGLPSFSGWFIPISSYTVLMLVLHHTMLSHALRSQAPGVDLRGPTGISGDALPHPEPAREVAHGIIRAFDDWHRDWADQDEPWPAFDCFLREQLLERVGAKQVRCFRIVAGGDRFLPLSGGVDGGGTTDAWEASWNVAASGPSEGADRGAAWQPRPFDPNTGIEGHVATTARPYIRGRSEQAIAVTAGGQRTPREIAWCFPVKRGDEVVGLIRVGHLPRTMLRDDALLEFVGDLVSLCWARVHDVHELGIARRTDLTSGVLARSDFLTVAGHALADSLDEHEPVALLIVALEGMRKLDDSAQWASRDRYVHVAGHVLNARLRTDDVIGRFSDDRFAVLLRRVDMALGKLIAAKLRKALREALYSEAAVATVSAEPAGNDMQSLDNLGVRCALVAGHRVPGAEPDGVRNGLAYLHDLVGNAFSLLEAARIRNEGVAAERDHSEAPPPSEVVLAGSAEAKTHTEPAPGGDSA